MRICTFPLDISSFGHALKETNSSCCPYQLSCQARLVCCAVNDRFKCALVCLFLTDLACPVVLGKLGSGKLGIRILTFPEVVEDVIILYLC